MQYLRNILKKADFFSTSSLLRYKDETAYSTATGGICSIIIIAVFCILFMNMAIATFTRQMISYTTDTQLDMDPTNTVIQTPGAGAGAGNFLFAVGIMGLNLNAPNRFFDITMREQVMTTGNRLLNTTEVGLVPCTEKHFAVTDALSAQYNKIPAYKWLCPPLDYSFQLQGKYTSQLLRMQQIDVKKCTNATNPLRPCVPDSTIDSLQAALGQFTITFFFINPLINPSNQNYLSYFLQDRNYITFTKTLGTYSNAYIADYSIQTDESLLPFTQNTYDKGIIIPELLQNINYQVTDGVSYASIYLLKSAATYNYQRSFYKVDDLFSYVGGLLGTIMGAMLIMNSFSESSFQVALASSLYHHEKNQPLNENQYHIGSYIMGLLYQGLSFVGVKLHWRKTQGYIKSQQEIKEQIDIQVILQKLIFLERSLQMLFSDHQWQGLHLMHKLTLKQAERMRQLYHLEDIINQNHIQNNNNSSNQKSFQANSYQNILQKPSSKVIPQTQSHPPGQNQSKKSLQKKMKLLQRQAMRKDDEISEKIWQVINHQAINDLFNRSASPPASNASIIDHPREELMLEIVMHMDNSRRRDNENQQQQHENENDTNHNNASTNNIANDFHYIN